MTENVSPFGDSMGDEPVSEFGDKIDVAPQQGAPQEAIGPTGQTELPMGVPFPSNGMSLPNRVVAQSLDGFNGMLVGYLDTLAKAGQIGFGGIKGLLTLLGTGDINLAVNQLENNPKPTVSDALDAMLSNIVDDVRKPGTAQFFESPEVSDLVGKLGGATLGMLAGINPIQGRNLNSSAGLSAELGGFGSGANAEQVSRGVPRGDLSAKQPGEVLPPSQLDPPTTTGLPAVIDNVPAPPAAAAPETGIQPYVPPPGTDRRVAAEIALKRNNGDISAVGWKLDDAGKAIPDPADKALLKSGWREDVVGTLKGLNAATRSGVRKMVNLVEQGIHNKGFAGDNPPSKVIGESLDARMDVLRRVTRQAGSDIDTAAKGLKGQTVNIEDPLRTFAEELKGQGINYNPATGELDFSKSSIRGIDATQRFLQRMVDYIRETPSKGRGRGYDAFDIHQAKRFYDTQVAYGKTTEGLPGQIERIVKNFRHNLDAALDASFPEYNTANQMYADAIEVLGNMQKAAGKNIDLTADSATLSLGKMSRKILSNYQNGDTMRDTFKAADDVTRKWGPKVGADMSQMQDDIVRLVDMETSIRNSVPGVARGNTLQGINSSDVVQGGEAIARGDTFGAGVAATKAAARKLGKDPNSTAARLKQVKALQKWLDAQEASPNPWR